MHYSFRLSFIHSQSQGRYTLCLFSVTVMDALLALPHTNTDRSGCLESSSFQIPACSGKSVEDSLLVLFGMVADVTCIFVVAFQAILEGRVEVVCVVDGVKPGHKGGRDALLQRETHVEVAAMMPNAQKIGGMVKDVALVPSRVPACDVAIRTKLTETGIVTALAGKLAASVPEHVFSLRDLERCQDGAVLEHSRNTIVARCLLRVRIFTLRTAR